MFVWQRVSTIWFGTVMVSISKPEKDRLLKILIPTETHHISLPWAENSPASTICAGRKMGAADKGRQFADHIRHQYVKYENFRIRTNDCQSICVSIRINLKWMKITEETLLFSIVGFDQIWATQEFYRKYLCQSWKWVQILRQPQNY